jgi:hypothetical protein
MFYNLALKSYGQPSLLLGHLLRQLDELFHKRCSNGVRIDGNLFRRNAIHIVTLSFFYVTFKITTC